MGLLDNYGMTNSIVLKNIEALYYAPKTEQQYVDDSVDINELSFNEILNLVPKNFYEDKTNSYCVNEPITIWGKDGQTNAYVKRGLDNEENEVMEMQLARKRIWYFLTDDKVEILSGGKLIAKGEEWFILKVISQETIGTEQNRFNAMYIPANSNRHKIFGQKLVVLV